MKTQVFLGLGSNIGNRIDYLEKAIRAIKDNPDITVLNVSSIYETEPFGDVEQDSFLNMVIKIETSLKPDHLLKTIRAIEKRLDRIRTSRWGPRTIDIDILLYGNAVLNSKTLTIPHIGIQERAFVLVPLLEIAPDVELPNGKHVKDFLKGVSHDVDNIKLFRKSNKN